MASEEREVECPWMCTTSAEGTYTFCHPARPRRSPRSTSSKYMKYRGSKPSTDSHASRRSSRQEPDNQPAVRSATAPSWREERVQGVAGQTAADTAWPTPRPRDGWSRAEG